MEKPYLIRIDVQDAYDLKDALNVMINENRHICEADPEFEIEEYHDTTKLKNWLRLAEMLDQITDHHIPFGFTSREEFRAFIDTLDPNRRNRPQG